jgi:hypothetical protein
LVLLREARAFFFGGSSARSNPSAVQVTHLLFPFDTDAIRSPSAIQPTGSTRARPVVVSRPYVRRKVVRIRQSLRSFERRVVVVVVVVVALKKAHAAVRTSQYRRFRRRVSSSSSSRAPSRREIASRATIDSFVGRKNKEKGVQVQKKNKT